jgi:hypothetical protein
VYLGNVLLGISKQNCPSFTGKRTLQAGIEATSTIRAFAKGFAQSPSRLDSNYIWWNDWTNWFTDQDMPPFIQPSGSGTEEVLGESF